MTREGDAAPSGAVALGLAYAANFGALAASTPFMAVHLGAVGFTPEAAAEVLALALLVRVVAVPLWTLLADRTRAAGRVLRIASGGALLTFGVLTLLATPSRALVALLLVGFAACRAPFGALLDTLMLHRARGIGRAFSAVRAFGTAGYAAAALVTGALVARLGSRAVLYVGVTLLAAALVAAGFVGRGDTSDGRNGGRAGDVRELLRLLRRPRLALVFVIALLSQLGLAPYDALFPAYLTRLAGATAAGAAVAIGAAAEFLLLLVGPSLARRVGAERVLVAACATSVLRWSAMAVVTNPVALVMLQALHALSFGAFYMASVILVDAEAPPRLRASALGLFGSLGFGAAAAAALSLAGIVEQWAGPRAIFGVAAGGSLLATVVALALARMHARRRDPTLAAAPGAPSRQRP